MATLPPSSDITNSSATEGNAKTWFSAVRTFIAQMLGTDGTQSAALSALGVPFNSSVIKTGAYTVVPADRGKVLKCSGTWPLAFSAVATLGDGFVVEVVNDGAGVITLDPDLSQAIDGVTTISLAAGKSLVVYCDGTKLVTFGRGGVETFNTRSGAVTLTSGDVVAALGYTPPANALLGYGNSIGSIMIFRNTLSYGFAVGAVCSASGYSLYEPVYGGYYAHNEGYYSISGSWVVVSQFMDNSYRSEGGGMQIRMFIAQRIA